MSLILKLSLNIDRQICQPDAFCHFWGSSLNPSVKEPALPFPWDPIPPSPVKSHCSFPTIHAFVVMQPSKLLPCLLLCSSCKSSSAPLPSQHVPPPAAAACPIPLPEVLFSGVTGDIASHRLPAWSPLLLHSQRSKSLIFFFLCALITSNSEALFLFQETWMILPATFQLDFHANAPVFR